VIGVEEYCTGLIARPEKAITNVARVATILPTFKSHDTTAAARTNPAAAHDTVIVTSRYGLKTMYAITAAHTVYTTATTALAFTEWLAHHSRAHLISRMMLHTPMATVVLLLVTDDMNVSFDNQAGNPTTANTDINTRNAMR